MRIRHLVAADNVDALDGTVLDPRAIRHGVIVGGLVAELAGPVDAATHLNLDFPEHRAGDCLVVQALAPGAAVERETDGRLRFARVRRASHAHLGRVDLDGRRLRWRAALASVAPAAGGTGR